MNANLILTPILCACGCGQMLDDDDREYYDEIGETVEVYRLECWRELEEKRREMLELYARHPR